MLTSSKQQLQYFNPITPLSMSNFTDSLTDDCSAVEALGMTVLLTDGSEENIKITTPLDLEIAELILKRREET